MGDRGKQKGEKTADLELKRELVWAIKQFGASLEEPSCWENKTSGAKEIFLGQTKRKYTEAFSKQRTHRQRGERYLRQISNHFSWKKWGQEKTSHLLSF